MAKHAKPKTPSDADLRGNPLIGGSKGLGRPRTEGDDLDLLEGENTVEGDRENDVTPQGGIDEVTARAGHTKRR
ncbi:hypothetical protein [Bosea thiooxidans]